MFEFIENLFDSVRVPFIEDGCFDHSPRRFLKERNSWMEMLYRILEEADNREVPIFERIHFLAITSTMLDEFISDKVREVPFMYSEIQSFMNDQERVWLKILIELGKENIFLVSANELTEADYPILAPYITPFPLESFRCVPDSTLTLAIDFGDEKRLIPLPRHFQRLTRLPDGPQGEVRFLLLEEILDSLIHALFPSKEVHEYTLFYAIRKYKKVDAYTKASVNKAIQKRECAPIVLVRMFAYTSKKLTRWIMKSLKATKTKPIKIMNTMKMDDFRTVMLPNRLDLLYPPFHGKKPYENLFQLLKKQDIILHHPYDSFEILTKFLEEAIHDPLVQEIRVSLFRTNQAFIDLLKKGAKQGKKVVVLIELRALGDEKQNVEFVKELENVGVDVLLGCSEKLTHGKALTVARKEGEKVVYYTHLSTGNYNTETAKVYSDIGFMSTGKTIYNIAHKVFPYSPPSHIKETLLKDIAKEIQLAKESKPASIWIKTIALTDLEVIDALYDASRAGVQIDIIARAICLLRPGIQGLSENIRVKSIIGRFLEHSRILCFGNGHSLPSEHAKVYLTSANWKPEALEHRVETLIEIENLEIKKELLHGIMIPNIFDEEQSWELEADGCYRRIESSPGQKKFNCQKFFMGSYF